MQKFFAHPKTHKETGCGSSDAELKTNKQTKKSVHGYKGKENRESAFISSNHLPLHFLVTELSWSGAELVWEHTKLTTRELI